MSERKIFILLLILIFIVYGQSLLGGFVFDDRGIGEHSALFSGLDKILQVFLYPYWTVEAGLYRPTSLLSYLFNITILGGSAFSFHLINLLLYAGVCFLIYLLFQRLFHNKRISFFSALLFLVLPIHTEVVANITGRLELLALFFSLLALWELAKEKANLWRIGLWAFLAIGAKETAIALLPLAFLIIFLEKKSYKELLGPIAGISAYFLLRLYVLGPTHFLGVETSIIENPLMFADTNGRVATALSVLWMYISKTFYPLNLCSDYSFNQIPVLTGFLKPSVLLGASALLGSIFSIIYFIRRNPPCATPEASARRVISFASAIFFFSFLPVSNVLFPVGTIAGERLFFFPSLGIALLIAYIFLKHRILQAILVLGIIIFAAISFQRQEVWMSEEKLFLNAVECSPNSVLSLSNAGTVYYFRGDYKTAEEYLEKSREIRPVYSKGLNNLGLVYWKQGRNREAEELYHGALKQKYPYYGAYENLVLLYLSEGDYESASRWLRVVYPNSEEEIQRMIEEYRRNNSI